MPATVDWSSWTTALDRERLVRLCTHLTGDPASSDDLTQQVLLEAWLHESNLSHPERREQWLNGIARNVCRRWRRAKARDRVVELAVPDEAPDDVDVELELERDELAELLDRALDMLRPEERALLIAHYIEELPRAELARRLDLQPGTLAVRLHRGRMALRRIFSERLRDDAASYGLTTLPGVGWVQTDLWCYLCAERRMIGRFDPGKGWLLFRCERCCPGSYQYLEGWFPEVLKGAKRVSPARRRASSFHQGYGWPALREGAAACIICGADMEIRREQPFPVDPFEFPTLESGEHGAYGRCRECGRVTNMTLRLLAFGLPEVQAFWRRHKRVRLLQEVTRVEADRKVLVVGAESVAGRDAIEVVCSAADYSVLDIKQLGEDQRTLSVSSHGPRGDA
jgi:RNA polymerase sigma-70 factor (ECF subfamily)